MDRLVKIGLKKAREKANISQVELASLMKVDISVIQGWEAGAAFPTVDLLKYMADLLDITTEMLLFSERRSPLDISNISDEEKRWIIDFYTKIIKNA